MFLFRKATEIPTADKALPGRDQPLPTAEKHYVSDRPLKPPFPDGIETVFVRYGLFLGC